MCVNEEICCMDVSIFPWFYFLLVLVLCILFIPISKTSLIVCYLMQSMTEALEAQVKNKVSIKGHLHTYRFCDNVWTFILQDAIFKSEECQENVSRVKIVACDSKLLTQ
ncbi:PREDICTED: transcription initiation factor IIA subunit 2 isoform X1 [Ipomoea nil]|uniref:transcription initiation factor IIA subunit 2 isoform X1 n=1 Tax=Ipomoea nil TaxID=35883 RepID=UPI000901E85D|nr:PREDICTED: transcription initiation factor IIA subunit 2 isoform X1 [Ipomoea nil]